MPERRHRVLIVGRSPAALIGAVDRLRELGYGANASNQFERLLEDYDVREVDLVLFGGMVPPPMRERLEHEVARINPSAQCASGRGGLAPLLAAQVQEHFQGAASGVAYRAETRSIRGCKSAARACCPGPMRVPPRLIDANLRNVRRVALCFISILSRSDVSHRDSLGLMLDRVDGSGELLDGLGQSHVVRRKN